MSNYSIEFVDGSNYLEHHGIQGQQWGEKHGPPYPLDSSVSTGKRLKDLKKLYSNTYKNIDKAEAEYSSKLKQNSLNRNKQISNIKKEISTISDPTKKKELKQKLKELKYEKAREIVIGSRDTRTVHGYRVLKSVMNSDINLTKLQTSDDIVKSINTLDVINRTLDDPIAIGLINTAYNMGVGAGMAAGPK